MADAAATPGSPSPRVRQVHKASPPRFQRQDITPASPPRQHLLFNNQLYGDAVRVAGEGGLAAESSRMNEEDLFRMQKQERGKEIREKHSLRLPKEKKSLVVSMFGKAERDTTSAKKGEGAKVQYSLSQVGSPRLVSVPTASRWQYGAGSRRRAASKNAGSARSGLTDEEGTAENEAVDISPCSYTPRAPQAHVRAAVFGSSPRGRTELVKGMLVTTRSESAAGGAAGRHTLEGESANPAAAVGAPDKASAAAGVGFSRARRFDTATGELVHSKETADNAQDGSGSRRARPGSAPHQRDLGPGAYDPHKAEKHVPSASFGKSPRTDGYSVRGEVVCYQTGAKSQQQGQDSASYPNDPSVIKHRGVTIPKAPSRPQSARQLNSTSSESPTDPRKIATGLYDDSIASRLNRSNKARFGKAARDRAFTSHHGAVVYVSERGGNETPGVGAYDVRDGNQISERLRTPSPRQQRRPQSARTPREAAVGDAGDATGNPSGHRSHTGVGHNEPPMPGPADYNPGTTPALPSTST